MKLVKIGAAALNQLPMDWEGNTRRILEVIREARSKEISILCLPELCVTGYGCEDAFHSPALHRIAWDEVLKIAAQTQGIIVSVGLPVSHRGAVFNCAALLSEGRVLGLVPKKSLAGDGIHYEPRWFKAWVAGKADRYEAFNPFGAQAGNHAGGQGEAAGTGSTEGFPFGDLSFECGGVRIGYEICEEAWVANRPGAQLAAQGVDVILNPSASHFAFGKFEIRKRFVTEGSRAFGAVYVYANLLGNESGRVIYDGGSLIASGGHIVQSGPRLSFAETCLTSAWVDVELNRMNRSRTASYQPEFGTEVGHLVRSEYRFPPAQVDSPTEAEQGPQSDWETSPDLKFEEFFRAESLALFDYLRKSRSSGYVVSLSGGVDSGVTAGLVSLGIQAACKELGLEEVKKRLSYASGISPLVTPQELAQRLLTCVYQGTVNSSQSTREAARAAAKAFHAEYHEWEIDDLVRRYGELASQAIGRPLEWKTDDISLQNIQARVRAPGVWMLANVKNAILLSTSNRSEAAVGYATMDGDTAGGLSPITGIDKAFLNRFIRWLQAKGPAGLGAVPALERITRMAPTAELRPSEQAQTDEKDLMPYEVLDFIERAAIRDKRSPQEAFKLVLDHFGSASRCKSSAPKGVQGKAQENASASYSTADLELWTKRFYTLWSRNQWKRERYAPSFHLDDESLDPKTWCRFPILSAAYSRELRELSSAPERKG